MPTVTLEAIQLEVGQWSQANFGQQVSKAPMTTVDMFDNGMGSCPMELVLSCNWADRDCGECGMPQLKLPTILGSVAPLLGLMEEVGEYWEATQEDDQLDALGDIGIYLCDYAAREGFILPEPADVLDRSTKWDPNFYNMDAAVGVATSIGRLAHCTLKRHQGIRGMDDDGNFKAARQMAVEGIIYHCAVLSREDHATSWLSVVYDTWVGIVRKRNWKSNIVSG